MILNDFKNIFLVTEGDLTFGGEHTCNIQMMYYKTVHLKPI